MYINLVDLVFVLTRECKQEVSLSTSLNLASFLLSHLTFFPPVNNILFSSPQRTRSRIIPPTLPGQSHRLEKRRKERE